MNEVSLIPEERDRAHILVEVITAPEYECASVFAYRGKGCFNLLATRALTLVALARHPMSITSESATVVDAEAANETVTLGWLLLRLQGRREKTVTEWLKLAKTGQAESRWSTTKKVLCWEGFSGSIYSMGDYSASASVSVSVAGCLPQSALTSK